MNRYDGRPDRSPEDDPWMTVDPLKTFDPEMQADPSATALPQAGIDETLDAVPQTGGTPNGPVTLDDDERSKISQACEKLECAWQESGDQEPRVEEFVPEDVEMGLRQILVRELVLLDIEHRKKRNNSLPPTEYLSRLSDCRSAVESALSHRNSSIPTCYGSWTVRMGKANPRTQPQSAHAGDPTTRYRPAELHVRGGLGAVFRAQDEELNRLVALKEILPKHSANPRYQEKFVFEAKVTGSLEHPGIVPVYGLGRYEDNQPYYAMRFIRGHCFRKTIHEFHEQNPTPSAGTYRSWQAFYPG